MYVRSPPPVHLYSTLVPTQQQYGLQSKAAAAIIAVGDTFG